MEKVIIIGGGIAGLSCLNKLLDDGESPLLLEEKTIGLPKICGEFLAPLASLQLQKWGIGPVQCIKQVSFFVKNKRCNVHFPQAAGAFSRSEAELGLAKRAFEKGGRIREYIRIIKIDPPFNNSPYVIHLDSGEKILSKAVFIATGKLNPHASTMVFPYQGFKIHIPQVIEPDTLYMSNYPGAYFGIVPIAAGVSNLTCLAKKKVIEKWGSSKEFFNYLIKITPLLKGIDMQSIHWLEGQAPDFKAQKIPNWQNAFWIGDALASFYPAIGYGFAHSVNSAVWASHFYLHGNAAGYNTFIKNEIKYKLVIGKLIHHSFMNQAISNCLLSATKLNPRFAQFLMCKLGYS